jgi:putative MATE family efflux protein
MSQDHKNVKSLEHEGIRRLLWKNFLPAFAGVIINSLYNIVDRIFIGQGVGALALSGLSAIFPIMLILMGFGMLVGIGAGVRVSINMGKKDFIRAEKVLGNAVIIIIILATVLSITGFIIKEPLLNLFGVGDTTYTYANEYLNIILFGTLFGMMGFSINNVIRSEGNFKIAMISMFISAGLNIALDPLFIFVFDMGVKGAAYATIISQFFLMVWVLRHFTGKHAVIKLKVKNFKLDTKIILYIFAIGFAPFSMQLAASLVQGTFNRQLTAYGNELALGALGIINSVAMLIFMSIIAINMASQPIIGYNFGAQKLQRVKETLLICLRAGTFISLGGFVVVELFPEFIIRLFESKNNELMEIGVPGLKIFMAAWGIVGFQIVSSSYFQAIGKPGLATFLSLLRQVIILIPALFILPPYLGLKGVWLAAPLSDLISAIVFAIFITLEIKKLNKAIATNSSTI